MKSIKFASQVSHCALTSLALGLLFSHPALAQSRNAPFSPASPWTVGSTELSTIRGLKSMKLPCVVSTEYDNGFVMRLSGGGGQLLAMAIDFRQDIFQQGKKYNAMLTVGDAYIKQVSATAFTANTLIFNLRPVGDIYGALKTAKTIEIDIDGNAMSFDLGNLRANLPNLESCYKGEKSPPPVAPLIAPVKQDAGDALPAPAPKAMSMVDEEPLSDMTPLPTPETERQPPKTAGAVPVSKPVPIPPQQPAKPSPAPLLPSDMEQKKLPQNFDEIVRESNAQNQTQNASAPAPVQQNAAAPQVQETSNRVSRRQDVATAAKPQQITPPAISQPPAVSANNVAQKPVGDGSVASQEAATITAAPLPPPSNAAPVQNQTAPSVSKVPTAPAAQLVTVPVQAAPAPKTFDAKAGEDLKIVLARWAERAGYDLDWQSASDGKVAQDVHMTGSFEDAVTQLLAENAAVTGIGGHIDDSGNRRDLPLKKTQPSAQQSVKTDAPVEAVIPALHQQWTAPAGANIQTVVDQWANKAGVTVIWQDYMTLPVKDDVSVDGNFETAVQALLDQYAGDSPRPLGQLNIDPDTGKRTLLIRSDR